METCDGGGGVTGKRADSQQAVETCCTAACDGGGVKSVANERATACATAVTWVRSGVRRRWRATCVERRLRGEDEQREYLSLREYLTLWCSDLLNGKDEKT
nr:hypothetical protein Iba_chr02fCG11720 [Ipomoea batatas]